MSLWSTIIYNLDFFRAVLEAPLRAHGFTVPAELLPVLSTSEMSVIFGALLAGLVLLKSGVLTRNTTLSANEEQTKSHASPKTLNTLASGLRVMGLSLSSAAVKLSKFFTNNK